MKTIIISPYSQKLPSGNKNPKDYPYWIEVIEKLKAEYHVCQVGVDGEEELPVDRVYFNRDFDFLRDLVLDCSTWVSVDNFFHHFCALHGKPGVVIFGKSDPSIFGHDININLLLSKDNLRHNQFDVWHSEPCDDSIWVSPDTVIDAVRAVIAR